MTREPETKEPKYQVYGGGVDETLGHANNFAECKALHQEWLERTNHLKKEWYAGLALDGGWLQGGMAFPAFYTTE